MEGCEVVSVHAGGDDTYFVKVAYHEGLVDGDVWLRVQDRKAHQNKFPNNGKTMNFWLVGMVKCACCGYAMHFNHCANRKGVVYHRFINYGKFTLNGCPKPPIQIKPKQVEDTVLKEMRKRIEQLHIEKHEASKLDAETESIRIDSEIQKLMEKLADADSVLFDYIQKHVTALHEQKSELDKKMQTMCRKRKAIDTKPLEETMEQWDTQTVQEKHELAAAMIEVVRISDETGIEVKFRI